MLGAMVLGSSRASGDLTVVKQRMPVVYVVDATPHLIHRLASDPDELYNLDPERFEILLRDFLELNDFGTERTGASNRKDGGVDLVFWPKSGIPYLGALQAKYHHARSSSTGSKEVRDFAGVLSAHPFQVGLLVTNTKFTPDAEWIARKLRPKLRLRDFKHLTRWFAESLDNQEEWLEIPTEIELCPGVIIPIPRPRIVNSPD